MFKKPSAKSVPLAPTRFDGSIEKLCDVDVKSFATWLRKFPSSEWHKATDLTWNGWGDKFGWPLASTLVAKHFPGARVYSVSLWTVEPGQVHPPHVDLQPPEHLVRVHVPIVTNKHATVTMQDEVHRLAVGSAYKFNTLAEHAIENLGDEPRVHFVLDIHAAPGGERA